MSVYGPVSRASIEASIDNRTTGLEEQLMLDQIRKNKLRKALEESRNPGTDSNGNRTSSGSTGSYSGSGSGSSSNSDNGELAFQRQRQLNADRDAEAGRAFDRQRLLSSDRQESEARMAAQQTADVIRQRQEASGRGLKVAKALRSARR